MKSTPNYSAWNVKETDFPEKGTLENQIKFLLRYGILAPSIHNTQPWKFKVEKDTLTILPDWEYQLPYSDPTNRGIFIALGACLCNIEVAAVHFGLSLSATVEAKIPKKTVIHVVFQKSKKGQSLDQLFPAITKRYSNKLAYTPKPIPEKTLQHLQSLSYNQAQVFITTDKTIIHSIAELHHNASSAYARHRNFKSEVAAWMRHSNTRHPDGMPGFVNGLSQPQSIIGRVLFKHLPPLVKVLAKKDQSMIENSSAIGVIAINTESITNWVDAGYLYELLSLTVTKYGLSLTPMAAMIEHLPSQKMLSQKLEINDYGLQMFYRIGYSDTSMYHTPRRSIEKCIV